MKDVTLNWQQRYIEAKVCYFIIFFGENLPTHVYFGELTLCLLCKNDVIEFEHPLFFGPTTTPQAVPEAHTHKHTQPKDNARE